MTSEVLAIILDKIREIQTRVQELETTLVKVTTSSREATLFDHVEDNPILVPKQSADSAENAPAEVQKPIVTRRRFEDGTMAASSIAFRLSKELGKPIPKEGVQEIAKQINAVSTYDKISHTRRYSPEAVKMIFSIYRQFNRL